MDEDITIINTNTRNEKIKNFFVNNKKKLIILLSIIILLFLSYFAFGEIKKRSKVKLANKYNATSINFSLDCEMVRSNWYTYFPRSPHE